MKKKTNWYYLPPTAYHLPPTTYHLPLTTYQLPLGIIHYMAFTFDVMPISREILDDRDRGAGNKHTDRRSLELIDSNDQPASLVKRLMIIVVKK